MVCGHGSRDPHAVAEFAGLAEKLSGLSRIGRSITVTWSSPGR
jgi:hypothetical protein